MDTPSIIVIEYADTALSRCEILLFTKLVYTKDLRVYPVVDQAVTYSYGEKTISGKEITEHGFYFTELIDNHALRIRLTKKED